MLNGNLNSKSQRKKYLSINFFYFASLKRKKHCIRHLLGPIQAYPQYLQHHMKKE